MTVVLNYDHEWDIDGLVIGREGTWKHISTSGMGVPESRVSDENRPQDHGLFFLGPDYLTGRVVEMTIGAEKDYGTGLQTLLDELKSKMRPHSDKILLRWRYGGVGVRRLSVRPRKCEFDLDESMYHGLVVAHLQFMADDPLIYDDVENLIHILPGATSGGLGFPHGFPHGFGSTSGSQLLAVNAGTAPSAPYGTVTATGTGINKFSIQNINTGELFSMTTAMNGGDIMEFDFQAKTVFLNGTASRSIDVERPFSKWWKVQPGGDTVGFVVEPNGTGSAVLDMAVRSAWY